MILGVSVWAVAVIAAALFAGALVQGMVGLGLGLVAAPVAAMAAPELMPGLLLWTGAMLPVLHLLRHRDHIDWRGLAWALPARVPGTVIGAWLVAVFTTRHLGIAVGVMVLVAVALTWRAVQVPVTARTLAGAGLVSGVTGTATSIGGPPIAILYQRRPPVQVRDTLAAYFLVGSLMSLAGLGVSGQLEVRQLGLALLLAPLLFGGLELARFARGRVDPAHVRPAILAVCGASAVILIVRSVLG